MMAKGILVATRAWRDGAIATAWASGGYTPREIGDYSGVHYSRVSRIVRSAERARVKARSEI